MEAFHNLLRAYLNLQKQTMKIFLHGNLNPMLAWQWCLKK